MINPLSQQAREMVLGTLLGDGCLVKPGKRKVYNQDKNKSWICVCRHYRLQFVHGPKQKEYIYWKYKLLEPICSIGYPKQNFIYNKKMNKTYERYDLVTRTLSYFTRLSKLLYPKGYKIVTRKYLNYLTPLSLSVWYMDDGTFDSKSGRGWLATNGFSFKENIIIQQYLLEKWNIPCTIVKERKQFKISFSKIAMIELCKIINPYILPSLQYKMVKTTSQPQI